MKKPPEGGCGVASPSVGGCTEFFVAPGWIGKCFVSGW